MSGFLPEQFRAQWLDSQRKWVVLTRAQPQNMDAQSTLWMTRDTQTGPLLCQSLPPLPSHCKCISCNTTLCSWVCYTFKTSLRTDCILSSRGLRVITQHFHTSELPSHLSLQPNNTKFPEAQAWQASRVGIHRQGPFMLSYSTVTVRLNLNLAAVLTLWHFKSPGNLQLRIWKRFMHIKYQDIQQGSITLGYGTIVTKLVTRK